MTESYVLFFAFGLTLLAGLSTGIGSFLAFFVKRTNTKILSLSLGFSAGVMIYVSFIELLPESRHMLMGYLGEGLGYWVALLTFFGGILAVALIDCLVPSYENPHHAHLLYEIKDRAAAKTFKRLHHVGIFTAVAIAVHNFPEGLATFISALSEPVLGISIALAIAIHNIPEGIAVSIPIYYGTGSRKKAFYYSFLSGLAEPLGALIGYLVLMRFINDALFGALFGIVAGIMVFISFDELLPAAQGYGEHHLSIIGLVGGMLVMAVSLVFL